MSAEVFISYASKDRKRILDLVDRLESAEVSVWIDQMSIEGATMWSQEIVSAIRNCKVLILAISGNSADSKNVVKELALASEGHKNILPVYLESAEIPESMAYQLAGIQRVEFFKGDEEVGKQSVIRALSRLGVTVNKDASIAAGEYKRTSQGASHATTSQAFKKGETTWWKIAAALGCVVALAVGIFFIDSSENETSEQIQSLAKPVSLDTNRVVVLPFKVIGTANETADMGYGLVSTLTSKLQPLQNLVVIAKESARKFKDSEQSPREIGHALGAGTIVTGEIQTSSDKIQVNIQLVNANTEALGWGSTFIKGNDEFLDLQSEIATKLASELIGGLDASETQQLAQKATESAEAMAEYEAGRREWNRRNKEGFDNAIKHFEKAIELDPNYAEPYVGLADTYGLLPIYNFAEPAVAMPKAKPYAQEAIKRNPNLAIAYTSIAMVNHVYDYNWLEAEANHRKALELNPNYATGHQWYGEYLYQTGQTALAFEHMSKAAELDPGSKIIKCQLAFCALLLNKIDFAEKAIKEALAIDPMFFFALEIKHLWLKQGNLEKTIDLVEEAREKYPNQANYLRLLFDLNWMANNRERALRCFIELQDKHNDSVQSHVIAQLYATLDEPENVYRWMQKSIDKRESMVPITMTYPPFEKYHKDPNFLKLFRQINHPLSKNKP